MVRIAGQAVPSDLGQNGRTALSSVLVLLGHGDRTAWAITQCAHAHAQHTADTRHTAHSSRGTLTTCNAHTHKRDLAGKNEWVEGQAMEWIAHAWCGWGS